VPTHPPGALHPADPFPRRSSTMKYIIAWALGVPGIVILAWLVFF
jgi:hypothetical protein